MALVEVVRDPERRAALVRDGIEELEAELADRPGLGGAALRTGYRTVTKLRPAFIEDNVDRMLPAAAPVLDRHRAAAGDDVAGYFAANAERIGGDLLAITDARAAAAQNRMARSVYDRLRPRALENVVAGMPRLARLVERYG